MALSVALVFPYAPPERGACSIRGASIKDYFEQQGARVVIFSPERNASSATGVLRYSGLRELRRCLRAADPDIIIGSSPPITHSVFALVWGFVHGKRRFLDARDPWTIQLEHLGTYRKKPFKLLFYRFLERLGYLLSERIFVVTNSIGDRFVRQGASPQKICLAPSGTLPEKFRFDASLRTQFRRRWGIDDNRPVLIFSGEFMGLGLDDVVKAIAPAILEKNALLVLLIPHDAREKEAADEIERLAIQAGLAGHVRVEDIRPMELDEVNARFCAADFGLTIMPNGWDYCIPAKAYDYAGTGLRTIGFGPPQSDLKEWLEKFNTGHYCGSLTELVQAIRDEIAHTVSDSERIKLSNLARLDFDRRSTAKILWEKIQPAPSPVNSQSTGLPR